MRQSTTTMATRVTVHCSRTGPIEKNDSARTLSAASQPFVTLATFCPWRSVRGTSWGARELLQAWLGRWRSRRRIRQGTMTVA